MPGDFTPYAPGQQGLANEIKLQGQYALGASGAVPAAASNPNPTCAQGLGALVRNSAGNYTVPLRVPLQCISDFSVSKQIAAVVAAKANEWRIAGTTSTTINGVSYITAVTFAGINNADAAADVEDNATIRVTVTGQAVF